MKELKEPKISMIINSDITTIELFDSESVQVFARVTLTNDQLASMLSRLHRTDCKIQVKNLELVGTKMEHQSFEFEIDKEMQYSRISINNHCLKALDDKGMAEWIPDNHYGSKDTFFEKDGKAFARTTIRRWV